MMRSKATAVMVNYRKLVNVEDFDQWTWDEVVKEAVKATRMRGEIEEILKTTYGDYIARLTISKVVKRGGLKQFCEETGLNYGTVRNWRSAYLSKEQLREYRIKQPEPPPATEPDTIVIVDDNSDDDSEPHFKDMFNGEVRVASELVVDVEAVNCDDGSHEPVSTEQLTDRFVVSSNIAGRRVDVPIIDHFLKYHVGDDIVSLTITFDNGDFVRVEVKKK